MEHYLPSTPGNVQWGLWDAAVPPVLTIASGDRVVIDTLSGEPDDLPDPSSGFAVLPDHREVLASAPRGPGRRSRPRSPAPSNSMSART